MATKRLRSPTQEENSEYEESSPTPSPASQEENSDHEELSLALLNINGLRNKTHEVKHIIARDKLHVVALCETRLNSKVKESEVYIPGFRMWRKDKNDKSNNKGGGVTLYVQDHIKTRLRPDLMMAEADEENPEAEIIWVEMDFPGSRPVLLGCCYRCKKDKTKYLKYIKETITLISGEMKDKDIFLMGDFNIDWLSDSEKKKADEAIKAERLDQIVKVPTRVALDSQTCIDHIYTNISDPLKPESIPTGCSDHNLITVKIARKDRKIPQSKGNFRSKQFKIEKFQEDMESKWKEVSANVKSLEEFTNVFLQLADKHAPLQNQDIYCLLKLDTQLESLVSDRDEEKYDMINNIYNSMKKTKKLQEMIDNYMKGKPQNPPEGKNDATESEETFPFHLPQTEQHPQQICQTRTETTDSGSDPIDSVGGQMTGRRSAVFQDTRFIEVKTWLEYVCDHVVKFIDETEAELWGLSVGFISAPIRDILNGYKKTGKFPDKLKKIKSFPFPTDNYIDIRQSSGPDRVHIILSYIFDVILYVQAKPFFIEDEKKSMKTLKEKLEQLETDWLPAEAVLLDFTSYFDTISHDLLITKLKESGFSDSDLELIESFLSIQKGSSGLPRGSCLAQLLPIIIINDLKKKVEPAVICNSYMMIYGNESEIKNKMKTVNGWAKQFNNEIRRKPFKPSELSAMFKILESMIHCHGDESNWIRAPGNIVKQNGDWEYDNVSKELELHFGEKYKVEPENVNNSHQRLQIENDKRSEDSAGDSSWSRGPRRREI